MSGVLIAGVGNLFLGDDAFGCEVARALLRAPPSGARVEDFGIRGLHLAYALLEPFEKVIVIDTLRTGKAPGTLSLLEPRTDLMDAQPETHGMNLPTVIANVRMLGGRLPPLLLLGCEPLSMVEGIGLSDPVTAAIPGAVAWARELCHQPMITEAST